MAIETTGCELELFADAHAWKRYFADFLRPYIAGAVLEVGAGIGETTAVLCRDDLRAWTSVEPSPDLFARLQDRYRSLDGGCEAKAILGTVADVPSDALFDTILYIDVLEHIEDDRAELVRAAGHLRPGGRIVTLSPAHDRLMSEFDRAIGHHRRYDRSMVSALTPSPLQLERVAYLDSAGMALSLANRVFMRQSLPTKSQIDVWSRYVVPVSKVIDRVTGFRFGKSIVAIWHMPAVERALPQGTGGRP